MVILSLGNFTIWYYACRRYRHGPEVEPSISALRSVLCLPAFAFSRFTHLRKVVATSLLQWNHCQPLPISPIYTLIFDAHEEEQRIIKRQRAAYHYRNVLSRERAIEESSRSPQMAVERRVGGHNFPCSSGEHCGLLFSRRLRLVQAVSSSHEWTLSKISKYWDELAVARQYLVRPCAPDASCSSPTSPANVYRPFQVD
jgi:hypothetical protein